MNHVIIWGIIPQDRIKLEQVKYSESSFNYLTTWEASVSSQ